MGICNDRRITNRKTIQGSRTSAKGKYTIGKIKVSDGEEQTFCSFIAFSESAQNALLALSDGDAVCVAGTAKLKVWNSKDGAKPQLDVTVSNVLSVYSIKKKRDRTQGESDGQDIEVNGKSAEYYAPKQDRGAQHGARQEQTIDDDIPF